MSRKSRFEYIGKSAVPTQSPGRRSVPAFSTRCARCSATHANTKSSSRPGMSATGSARDAEGRRTRKNVPSRTRPAFDCFLKNATRSRTGRMSFSCMSATSHAIEATPASERRNDVQILVSMAISAKPHVEGMETGWRWGTVP